MANLLDLDNPEHRKILVELVRAAVDTNDRQPSTRLQQGTVIAVENDPDQPLPVVTVHLDGDPENVAVPIANATGTTPVENDRVLVATVPPQGGFVLSSLVDRTATREVVFSQPDDTTTADSPKWGPPADATLLFVRSWLGTAGSTDTTIDVLVNGSDVYTVTLAAGVTDSGLLCLNEPLESTDVLSVEITSAGTDAEDWSLVAYVCYAFPCDTECVSS